MAKRRWLIIAPFPQEAGKLMARVVNILKIIPCVSCIVTAKLGPSPASLQDAAHLLLRRLNNSNNYNKGGCHKHDYWIINFGTS
jgi:hypothetical protein